MTNLALLFGIGFALCLVATPLAHVLGRRSGLVDRPDGRRKLHRQAIPVTGGIAVFCSSALALLTGYLSITSLRTMVDAQQLAGLLFVGAAICALGVLDDLGKLRGRHKLIGQFAIAALATHALQLAVERITFLHWQIELGLLAVPFTLFWLVGAINALNLLDGMDGLLSSVAMPIFAAVALLAAINQQWLTAAAALATAGALLAFLVFNFPPASIFLGDAGSMLIGLFAGVLALQACTHSSGALSIPAPLALFTLPALDTLAAIIRRKLTGRSIFTTDRGHLHHCLHNRGLSPRGVMVCVLALGVCLAGAGLLGRFLQNDLIALAMSCGVATSLVATRTFGHAEFRLIKHKLRQLFVPVLGEGHGTSNRGDVCLQGSIDWRKLMDLLTDDADAMHLKSLRLDINAPALHEGYHGVWKQRSDVAENVSMWRAEIPVVLHGQTVGQLTAVGVQDNLPMWQRIAELMQSISIFESASTGANSVPALAAPHYTVLAVRERTEEAAIAG